MFLVMAMVVSALAPVLALVAPAHPVFAAGETGATASNSSSANSSLVSATPVDVCQLYPIALHTSSLAGVTVGGAIPSISNGAQPGNFGWLSWAGDQGNPALVTSLTPPGNSTSYTNPNNANDHVLVVGDWVDGRPGVGNSSDVRSALTQLESQAIVVPVWDQAQGQGANTQYHIVGFAQVRITGFQLASLNTISARYLGSTDCLGTPPPPPPPPPSPFNGATLTLSPATAGPDVTGTTQGLQATLTSRTGTPISDTPVQLAVTGANTASLSATTDSNGIAAFSYAGATQGSDSAQAIATDPNTSAQLKSNTAAIYWVTPAQTVSTTTIWGRFYPNPTNAGNFSATTQMTPSFSEAFPTIDFNPPSGTVPGNTSGVNEFTRPITDVTTDLNGNFTGVIPAQGNGFQAGVGSLNTFDAVFTGAFTIAAPGDVTYNFYTDDGFILGIGNGATRVGGADTNPPPSGQTPFMNFPVMGAYNVPTSPSGNQITVSFPAAGTYPFELDYSECCGGQLAVTAATVTATGTQGVPPTGAVTLSPSSVASQVAGGAQTFTALATYASGAVIPNLPVELDITGANQQRLDATTDSTGHATFTYTGTYAGTDTAQAVTWVSGLAAYSAQVTLTWTPGTTPPPTPQTQTPGWIGSPAPNAIVSGQVPITLASNVTLATGSGTVDYWPAASSSASSTTAPLNSANVVASASPPPTGVTTLATGVSGSGGATLATLDTTTLANGSYIIRLQGTDTSGNQLISETLVSVAGTNKPGRMTFSATDLTVPVAGLPITIGRTYDSLNRNQVGDFGNGWSLAIGSPKLTVDPAHNVTLTMPDGRRVTFDFTPQSTGGLFGFLLTPGYTPELGVYGSLTANGCNPLVVSGGQYVCFLDAQYAPTTYTYTDPYGRVYVMGADGSLKSITDLNGNELVFGSTGITSAAQNSVSFTRDSQGRITAISTQMNSSTTVTYSYSYDTNGDLVGVTYPGVSQPVQYTYSNHLLTSATDADNHTVGSAHYDTSGRLVSATDANQNTTTYAYDLATNTTTITEPDKTTTVTLAYDAFGDLTSAIDGLGRKTTFGYDTNHNLTSVSNVLGSGAFTYDGQGNRTSYTDPDHQTSSATYNQFGGIASLTTPLTSGQSETIKVSYDNSFRPTSISDTLGTLGSYTWDSHGDPLTKTDANGATTTYAYDAYGDVTSVLAPGQQKASAFTYDSLGHKLSSTDPLGNLTTYSYDGLGHVTSVTEAAQTSKPVTTSYTYDGKGNLVSMEDANHNVTSYTYDANNHLLQVTYPDLTTEAYTYDWRGNILTQTDQAKHVTQYTYNAAGQEASVTTAYGTADAATTTFGYDAAGNQNKVTDANGSATQTTYDAAGRVLSVTNQADQSTSYTYNDAGQVLSTTDGNGFTTSYTRDVRGRITSTLYPDGTTSSATYDGMGRTLTATDQDGNTTTSTYDPLGELLTVALPTVTVNGNPVSPTTTYSYDADGNLLKVVDANQHATTYSYNALNQLTQKTLPDGSYEAYTYDPVGNELTARLTDGHTNTYSYDSMNRLTGVQYFDSTSVGYTYTPDGQQQTVVDGRGTTTYSYDNQDRVTKILLPDSQSVSYSYDPAGNRLTMTSPAGQTTYGYDTANELTTLTDPVAGKFQFAYDKAGNLTQRLLPNGDAVAYGYDKLEHLTSVHETQGTATLASYAYTLDAAGNRTKAVEADGTTSAWAYNADNQLTSETITSPTSQVIAQASYTYDGVGNRLTLTSGGQTTSYSYNALDQLTSLSGAQTASYSYDGRGNLTKAVTSSGTTSYGYNAANDLTSVTLPNTTTYSYGYDVAGRRVSQSVGGATTNYVWDEQSANGDIVAETNASGAVQASYAVANGAVLAQTQAGATSYSLPDGQGSLRALTNASGAITDSYRYDAFGNVLSHQGATSSVYGYDSQRYDAASNLYALRARSYDPTTGRFLARDPATSNATDPLQLDRYVYAAADPIMQSDPSGLNIGDEYGQIVAQDTSISAAELPELSSFAQGALNLFALVVENVTGVALTPTEYAWVAWGLAALEEFQADLAAARAIDNAITYLLQLGASSAGSGAAGGGPASSPAPSPGGINSGSTHTYLYHYTPVENIPGIIATGLNPSKRDPADPKSDAQWGDGQYFTDLTPQEASTGTMFQLSRTLYNGPWHWGKRTRTDIGWIKIDVSGLPVVRVASTFSSTYGPRSIYLNPTSMPLSLNGRVGGTGTVIFQPSPQDLGGGQP